MKKWTALLCTMTFLISTACLLPVSVSAEDVGGQVMQVINCSDWVSLRAEPDANSVCLAEVPLGTVLPNCYPYSDEFIAAEYEGEYGYILSQYLLYIEPAASEYAVWGNDYDIFGSLMEYEELINLAETILDETVGDYRLVAAREFGQYDDGGEETLYICCYDEQLQPLWGYMTYVDFITELNATDAFLAGTQQNPLAAIYNSEAGLFLVDVTTGEQLTKVSSEQLCLGGSLCHAVGDDGTMYLSGYYAQDLVAVSMAGECLWVTDPGNEDVYWPYEISLDENDVIVNYESGTETGHYVAGYRLNGEREWIKIAEGS